MYLSDLNSPQHLSDFLSSKFKELPITVFSAKSCTLAKWEVTQIWWKAERSTVLQICHLNQMQSYFFKIKSMFDEHIFISPTVHLLNPKLHFKIFI